MLFNEFSITETVKFYCKFHLTLIIFIILNLFLFCSLFEFIFLAYIYLVIDDKRGSNMDIIIGRNDNNVILATAYIGLE